jgi:GNAT superfamily N-acetyltransferase
MTSNYSYTEYMHIRKAIEADSTALTRLSGELGYPATEPEIVWRLKQILPDPAHYVAVAEIDGSVIGWIAAEKRLTLESGIKFEIIGLVVNFNFHRKGVATELLNGAESWVRESGGGVVSVRSNILREESHALYLARGYSHEKTQHVYAKPV